MASLRVVHTAAARLRAPARADRRATHRQGAHAYELLRTDSRAAHTRLTLVRAMAAHRPHHPPEGATFRRRGRSWVPGRRRPRGCVRLGAKTSEVLRHLEGR